MINCDKSFDEFDCRNGDNPCPKYDSCLLEAKHKREFLEIKYMRSSFSQEKMLEKYYEFLQTKMDQWVTLEEIADHFNEPLWVISEKFNLMLKKKWFLIKKKPRVKQYKAYPVEKTVLYQGSRELIKEKGF